MGRVLWLRRKGRLDGGLGRRVGACERNEWRGKKRGRGSGREEGRD